VKYLLQDSVIDYIAANSLYTSCALTTPDAVNNNAAVAAAETGINNK